VPRLTQQTYLEAVFDFFNRQTPEQQMDLMKMMYSIEIMQSLPDDFLALYEDRKLGRTIADGDAGIVGGDISNMRRYLRNGILTVTSQIFYETLAGRLVHDSIPLEDIFLFIAIYESGLGVHANYSDESWFKFFPGFISNYIYLQDVFFEQIMQQLNIPLEVLISDYNTFNAALKTPWVRPYHVNPRNMELPQIEFKWLDPQKNDFLMRYFQRTGENKTASVRQAAYILG